MDSLDYNISNLIFKYFVFDEIYSLAVRLLPIQYVSHKEMLFNIQWLYREWYFDFILESLATSS